ncbi:MAG TPA: thiamine pyrophosphate-binding protein, partial [Pirellula sp.]|nr:thiamine pyrophosphate-binding protein [Pirellula sp.]
MITSAEFCEVLLKHNYSIVTGVPCSYLTPLINYSMTNRSFKYVNAANEGDAVAIAAGASLGGWGSVAMFQNSGLGNAVSPLTSLTWVFRIPILLIVTWRGQPGGPKDEPQHELMGKITTEQLRLMDIPFWQMPRTVDAFGSMMSEVNATLDRGQRPVALLLEKDSIAPQVGEIEWNLGLKTKQPFAYSQPSPNAFDPDEVIRCIANSLMQTDFVVATTGYTGR